MTPTVPRNEMATPAPRWRRRAHKAALVQAFLLEPEHQGLSDREIGRRCGVSHQLVAAVRAPGANGAVRLARRGATTYSMRTEAINAARAVAKQRDVCESQAPAAVERRRLLAARAYQAMRTHIAGLGALTPAGQRCLHRDWRRMRELERLDLEVRAAGQAFIQGQAGAEGLLQAAVATCERAWAEIISMLRRAQRQR